MTQSALTPPAAPELRKFTLFLPWGMVYQPPGEAKPVLLQQLTLHEIGNVEEELLAATDEGPEGNRTLEVFCSLVEGASEAIDPATDPREPVTVTDREELRRLIREMVDPDQMWALLEVRRNSLGSDYEFDIPCHVCDKLLEQEYDLESVALEEPNDPWDREFKYRIPGRAELLVFRHQVIGDLPLQTTISSLRDGKSLARKLALCLVSAAGVEAPAAIANRKGVITDQARAAALEKRVALIEQWLPSFNAKQDCFDRRWVWEAGPDFSILVTCYHGDCRKQQRIRMPVEITFFLKASRERARSKAATRSGRPSPHSGS